MIQVVRCCLEHAASVAKTFLMSDCVVVEIKEPEPVVAGNPMDNSGICLPMQVILFFFFSFFLPLVFLRTKARIEY